MQKVKNGTTMDNIRSPDDVLLPDFSLYLATPCRGLQCTEKHSGSMKRGAMHSWGEIQCTLKNEMHSGLMKRTLGENAMNSGEIKRTV